MGVGMGVGLLSPSQSHPQHQTSPLHPLIHSHPNSEQQHLHQLIKDSLLSGLLVLHGATYTCETYLLMILSSVIFCLQPILLQQPAPAKNKTVIHS